MARPSSTAALAGPIGGASDDGGVEYRRAVAAYAVAHALAGEPLPGFGFELAQARVSAVAVETDEYVDDVRVTLRDDRVAQVQAKRTLGLDKNFRSAVAQWSAAARAGLDPGCDRLVLVTGKASGPVMSLAKALERCKTDQPGAFTQKESDNLTKLDALLSDLSEEQRTRVHRCAVIMILDVEDEHSQGASHARHLLGHVVGGGDTARRAWRDLVHKSGRVARLRGGFTVEGWVRLLQEDGNHITGSGTPAAEVARRAAAIDRYRDDLKSRGTVVELRSLGAALPRIPLHELDASVDSVPEGADRRDREPLAWSLLRRSRVLLTGLPGGGKSVAVAAAAAVLVDVAGAPLPLVVSLRDVDARCRSQGFADRMLDTAVKDVPAGDRLFVRETLEQGLTSGATAVLLDSLDETHDRRDAVVTEIEGLCGHLHPDVPILLATRDVAYAQASTLGWDDVRLIEPREPERAVRAILNAAAAARSIDPAGSWVEHRIEWVGNVLQHDRAVRETPLMPVLLALLAAGRGDGKLPTARAQILYGIVEAAVHRREAQRGPGLRLGPLGDPHAANAMLAAFAVEARVLGDGGGHASLTTVHDAITVNLVRDWELRRGIAASVASSIVHFWDEIGIFVIHGSEEIVAPRIELFLDIGEAIGAKMLPPSEAAAWVDARIRDRRYEPLILGAALSATLGERLITTACETGSQDLLIAAATAIHQQAPVSGEDRERLLFAMAEHAARPDLQGWETFVAMIDVIGGESSILDLEKVLKNYGRNYQAIARAALSLARPSGTVADQVILLDALRVRGVLGPRKPRGVLPMARFRVHPRDAFHEKIIEQAARRLLGRVEEATGLVLDLLAEVSVDLNRKLIDALQRAGLNDVSDAVLTEQSNMMNRALSSLSNYERNIPEIFLSHLAKDGGAILTAAHASKLDELADLYQTLGLDMLSAWPKLGERSSWLALVDVICELGGFDQDRLAAEARIAQERVDQSGEVAFSALNIKSNYRDLDHWSQIGDPEAAVSILTDSLFKGWETARVAAAALAEAPPELAIPSLESALVRLQSSRQYQALVAHSLAHQKDYEPLAEWAISENATLRLVAAEALPAAIDEQLDPLLHTLARDQDRYVATAALHRIAETRISAAAEYSKEIAESLSWDWICADCGEVNDTARGGCRKCRYAPPDPTEVAGELLAKVFGDYSFSGKSLDDNR